MLITTSASILLNKFSQPEDHFLAHPCTACKSACLPPSLARSRMTNALDFSAASDRRRDRSSSELPSEGARSKTFSPSTSRGHIAAPEMPPGTTRKRERDRERERERERGQESETLFQPGCQSLLLSEQVEENSMFGMWITQRVSTGLG